jgi:4-aminobutyrate aminotransferase/(S)-3-amino-2-methylpropionate transaminase
LTPPLASTDEPGTNASWYARLKAVTPRAFAPAPIFAHRARNSEIWDVEGKRYIDFYGGIGVLNVGHRHPMVMKRIREMEKRLLHTCAQVICYPEYVQLAEKLAVIAPGPTPKKLMFFNSGAEAVENAIKVARAATGRDGVIAFDAAFHGRTYMTSALTGKNLPYKKGFRIAMPGVFHVPFPSAYHGISEADSLKALEQRFRSDILPEDVAAIIIEPEQGEGGFNPAPLSFMKALRELCDRHGILLICDEVQSGIGRTGKWFAIEHSGIEPDLMTTAKSLGDGLPISGVIGKASIMDKPEVSALGGTYGGNPLSCAAALGVIEAVQAGGLLDRATAIGDRIRSRFTRLAEELPVIGDVRGLGAMVAVELVKDKQTKEPATALVKDVIARAREQGLLLLSCGPDSNAIRFLMPLTIKNRTLDEGFDIFERVLRESLAAQSGQ